MTKTDPKGKIYIFQYFLLKISELLSEINTNIFFAKIGGHRGQKIFFSFFLRIGLKRVQKNFRAISVKKIGQKRGPAGVYGKFNCAKTAQNFEKQRKTNLRNRSAQLFKKRASRSEKRRPSYAVHFERVKCCQKRAEC